MLNYFRQPFLAPNDNEVQAAISVQMIKGEQLDWQNAPNHFELYSLGGVDQEEGTIEVDKQLICTLDSLIRPDLRTNPGRGSGEGSPAAPQDPRLSPPQRTPVAAGPGTRHIPSPVPAKALKGKTASRRSRRSPKGIK